MSAGRYALNDALANMYATKCIQITELKHTNNKVAEISARKEHKVVKDKCVYCGEAMK